MPTREEPHWTEPFEVSTTDASCEDCDETFNDNGAWEEQEGAIEEHVEQTGHTVAYDVTLTRRYEPKVGGSPP